MRQIILYDMKDTEFIFTETEEGWKESYWKKYETGWEKMHDTCYLDKEAVDSFIHGLESAGFSQI